MINWLTLMLNKQWISAWILLAMAQVVQSNCDTDAYIVTTPVPNTNKSPTCYFEFYQTQTFYTDYLELEFYYSVESDGTPIIQSIGGTTKKISTDEVVRATSYCPTGVDTTGLFSASIDSKNKDFQVITPYFDGKGQDLKGIQIEYIEDGVLKIFKTTDLLDYSQSSTSYTFTGTWVDLAVRTTNSGFVKSLYVTEWHSDLCDCSESSSYIQGNGITDLQVTQTGTTSMSFQDQTFAAGANPEIDPYKSFCYVSDVVYTFKLYSDTTLSEIVGQTIVTITGSEPFEQPEYSVTYAVEHTGLYTGIISYAFPSGNTMDAEFKVSIVSCLVYDRWEQDGAALQAIYEHDFDTYGSFSRTFQLILQDTCTGASPVIIIDASYSSFSSPPMTGTYGTISFTTTNLEVDMTIPRQDSDLFDVEFVPGGEVLSGVANVEPLSFQVQLVTNTICGYFVEWQKVSGETLEEKYDHLMSDGKTIYSQTFQALINTDNCAEGEVPPTIINSSIDNTSSAGVTYNLDLANEPLIIEVTFQVDDISIPEYDVNLAIVIDGMDPEALPAGPLVFKVKVVPCIDFTGYECDGSTYAGGELITQLYNPDVDLSMNIDTSLNMAACTVQPLSVTIDETLSQVQAASTVNEQTLVYNTLTVELTFNKDDLNGEASPHYELLPSFTVTVSDGSYIIPLTAGQEIVIDFEQSPCSLATVQTKNFEPIIFYNDRQSISALDSTIYDPFEWVDDAPCGEIGAEFGETNLERVFTDETQTKWQFQIGFDQVDDLEVYYTKEEEFTMTYTFTYQGLVPGRLLQASSDVQLTYTVFVLDLTQSIAEQTIEVEMDASEELTLFVPDPSILPSDIQVQYIFEPIYKSSFELKDYVSFNMNSYTIQPVDDTDVTDFELTTYIYFNDQIVQSVIHKVTVTYSDSETSGLPDHLVDKNPYLKNPPSKLYNIKCGQKIDISMGEALNRYDEHSSNITVEVDLEDAEDFLLFDQSNLNLLNFSSISDELPYGGIFYLTVNVSDSTEANLTREYQLVLIIESCMEQLNELVSEEGVNMIQDFDQDILRFFLLMDQSNNSLVNFTELYEFIPRLDRALPEKRELQLNQSEIYELYRMFSPEQNLTEFSQLDENYTDSEHFYEALKQTFGSIEIDHDSVAAFVRTYIVYNDFESTLGQMFYQTRLLDYNLTVLEKYFDARIKYISQTGQVVIQFSETLYLPQNLTFMLNDTTLRVEVEPSADQDSLKLGFTWQAEQITNETLTLQLTFENPKWISQASTGHDTLVVEFLFPSLFISRDKTISEQSLEIEKYIPAQLTQDQADSIIKTSVGISVTATAGFTSSLLLGTVLQVGLSQVWAMLRGIQIMTHIILVQLAYTANLQLMVNRILKLATFDLLETDEFYENNFKMTLDEYPYNEAFDQLDYGTNNIIINMGTNFIILLIYLLVFFIMLVLFLIKRLCCKVRFARWQSKLQKSFMWNNVSIFVMENYLEFTLITVLYLMHTYNNTSGDVASIILVTFLVFMIFIYPAIILIKVFKNRDQLKKPEFVDTYGAFHRDLRLKIHGISSLLFPLQFMLRRIIIMLVLIFMFHAPFYQIICMVLLQLSVLMYLGHAKPFDRRGSNVQEFFNEWLNLVFTYHLFLFTDYVPDPDTRWGIGTSAITILILYMVINLIIVFVQGLIGLCVYCKRQRRIKEIKSKVGVRSQPVKGRNLFIQSIGYQPCNEDTPKQPLAPRLRKSIDTDDDLLIPKRNLMLDTDSDEQDESPNTNKKQNKQCDFPIKQLKRLDQINQNFKSKELEAISELTESYKTSQMKSNPEQGQSERKQIESQIVSTNKNDVQDNTQMTFPQKSNLMKQKSVTEKQIVTIETGKELRDDLRRTITDNLEGFPPMINVQKPNEDYLDSIREISEYSQMRSTMTGLLQGNPSEMNKQNSGRQLSEGSQVQISTTDKNLDDPSADEHKNNNDSVKEDQKSPMLLKSNGVESKVDNQEPTSEKQIEESKEIVFPEARSPMPFKPKGFPTHVKKQKPAKEKLTDNQEPIREDTENHDEVSENPQLHLIMPVEQMDVQQNPLTEEKEDEVKSVKELKEDPVNNQQIPDNTEVRPSTAEKAQDNPSQVKEQEPVSESNQEESDSEKPQMHLVMPDEPQSNRSKVDEKENDVDSQKQYKLPADELQASPSQKKQPIDDPEQLNKESEHHSEVPTSNTDSPRINPPKENKQEPVTKENPTFEDKNEDVDPSGPVPVVVQAPMANSQKPAPQKNIDKVEPTKDDFGKEEVREEPVVEGSEDGVEPDHTEVPSLPASNIDKPPSQVQKQRPNSTKNNDNNVDSGEHVAEQQIPDQKDGDNQNPSRLQHPQIQGKPQGNLSEIPGKKDDEDIIDHSEVPPQNRDKPWRGKPSRVDRDQPTNEEQNNNQDDDEENNEDFNVPSSKIDEPKRKPSKSNKQQPSNQVQDNSGEEDDEPSEVLPSNVNMPRNNLQQVKKQQPASEKDLDNEKLVQEDNEPSEEPPQNVNKPKNNPSKTNKPESEKDLDNEEPGEENSQHPEVQPQNVNKPKNNPSKAKKQKPESEKDLDNEEPGEEDSEHPEVPPSNVEKPRNNPSQVQKQKPESEKDLDNGKPDEDDSEHHQVPASNVNKPRKNQTKTQKQQPASEQDLDNKIPVEEDNESSKVPPSIVNMPRNNPQQVKKQKPASERDLDNEEPVEEDNEPSEMPPQNVNKPKNNPSITRKQKPASEKDRDNEEPVEEDNEQPEVPLSNVNKPRKNPSKLVKQKTATQKQLDNQNPDKDLIDDSVNDPSAFYDGISMNSKMPQSMKGYPKSNLSTSRDNIKQKPTPEKYNDSVESSDEENDDANVEKPQRNPTKVSKKQPVNEDLNDDVESGNEDNDEFNEPPTNIAKPKRNQPRISKQQPVNEDQNDDAESGNEQNENFDVPPSNITKPKKNQPKVNKKQPVNEDQNDIEQSGNEDNDEFNEPPSNIINPKRNQPRANKKQPVNEDQNDDVDSGNEVNEDVDVPPSKIVQPKRNQPRVRKQQPTNEDINDIEESGNEDNENNDVPPSNTAKPQRNPQKVKQQRPTVNQYNDNEESGNEDNEHSEVPPQNTNKSQRGNPSKVNKHQPTNEKQNDDLDYGDEDNDAFNLPPSNVNKPRNNPSKNNKKKPAPEKDLFNEEPDDEANEHDEILPQNNSNPNINPSNVKKQKPPTQKNKGYFDSGNEQNDDPVNEQQPEQDQLNEPSEHSDVPQSVPDKPKSNPNKARKQKPEIQKNRDNVDSHKEDSEHSDVLDYPSMMNQEKPINFKKQQTDSDRSGNEDEGQEEVPVQEVAKPKRNPSMAMKYKPVNEEQNDNQDYGEEDSEHPEVYPQNVNKPRNNPSKVNKKKPAPVKDPYNQNSAEEDSEHFRMPPQNNNKLFDNPTLPNTYPTQDQNSDNIDSDDYGSENFQVLPQNASLFGNPSLVNIPKPSSKKPKENSKTRKPKNSPSKAQKLKAEADKLIYNADPGIKPNKKPVSKQPRLPEQSGVNENPNLRPTKTDKPKRNPSNSNKQKPNVDDPIDNVDPGKKRNDNSNIRPQKTEKPKRNPSKVNTQKPPATTEQPKDYEDYQNVYPEHYDKPNRSPSKVNKQKPETLPDSPPKVRQPVIDKPKRNPSQNKKPEPQLVKQKGKEPDMRPYMADKPKDNIPQVNMKKTSTQKPKDKLNSGKDLFDELMNQRQQDLPNIHPAYTQKPQRYVPKNKKTAYEQHLENVETGKDLIGNLVKMQESMEVSKYSKPKTKVMKQKPSAQNFNINDYVDMQLGMKDELNGVKEHSKGQKMPKGNPSRVINDYVNMHQNILDEDELD